MESRSSRRALVEPLESRTLLSATIVGTPVVVNVNRESGYQGEGAIAINPANPNQLFAASNDITNPSFPENPFDIMGATSNDGGQTWAAFRFATGTDGLPQARSDPTAAFDRFGNLFFAYIRQDTGEVEVVLSTDGGASLHLLATLHGAGNDQPTVVTGANSVWVTLQKDPLAGSSAKIAQAGAAAFGAQVTGLGKVGAFKHLDSIAGPGSNVGDVAIGPAGQVTVAYEYHTPTGPNVLYTRTDPDGLGPKGFGPVNSQVSTFIGFPGPGIPPQPDRGIDAEAGLAYDLSGGPYTGRVYLVYNDAPDGNVENTNIFLRYSDDDGATWSNPVTVNDDNTLSDQFFPKIAVDPTTGAVAITWYDTRNSSDNSEAQVWSVVGTPTATGVDFSPNFVVQPAFSNASATGNLNDYGDYIGEAFYAGQLHAIWCDNSNSTGDNPDGALSSPDMYASYVTVQTTPTAPMTFLGQFGDVGPLKFGESDGTQVTLSLRGGIGTAWLDGANLQLRVGGTDIHSVLAINAKGGSRQVSLGNVMVLGSIGSFDAPGADLVGTMSVQGEAKHVLLADVAGGTLATAGTLDDATFTNLLNARVLAGANPGVDGLFSGAGDTDDSYGPGIIDTLRVKGSMQGSVIGAGVNPVDGVFGNGNDTIIGGSASRIDRLIVKSADSVSRFESGVFTMVKLPKRLDAATDPRFLVG